MENHFGRYEIVEELGRGAMGIVYKARDPLIERLVAIKTINLQTLPEKEKKEYAARFYQEAKAAGLLNHPNIVTIHDLGGNSDMAYIAMELMEGRELQAVIDGGHSLSIEEALDIAIQVATGLHYAHQRGIVHRDIKPSNIMLLGGGHVKIADFGIARMSSSLAITQAGTIMGSPLYMSPEQVLGEEVDPRSDIFSLGIVLYQMLSAHRPFFGDSANSVMYQIVNEEPPRPGSMNPDVSVTLDNIVLKCLAKKPEDRYATARDLADDLKSCREKLAREKVSIENPFVTGARLDKLKRLVTPGGIPQAPVAIVSFLALAIIFAIDVTTESEIQMHMLYIFPLVMVSYHCERVELTYAALLLALLFQAAMLVLDIDLETWARIAIAIFVLPSNIMITYVARIARRNFLEAANLFSYDKLTGLRNRLSFEFMLDAEIGRQREHRGVFSFVHININRMNELNDSRGFLVGDEALRLVAEIVLEHIRTVDIAGRLGRNEFSILMPNTGEPGCRALCAELSGKISGKMAEAGLPVSASIGYATFEQPPVSLSEILDKAEAAVLQ